MAVQISTIHSLLLALLLLSPLVSSKKARKAVSWAPQAPAPPLSVQAAAVSSAAVLVQLPLPGGCSIVSLAVNVIEPSLTSLNTSATATKTDLQSQNLIQSQSQTQASGAEPNTAPLAVNSSQITTTLRSTSTSTATVIRDVFTAIASIAAVTQGSHPTIIGPSITSTSASFASQPSSSTSTSINSTTTSTSTAANSTTTSTTTNTTTGTKSCVSDFSAHNILTDCYVLHSGLVYDLTSWIPKHPGGKNVYTGLCGGSGSVFDDAFKGKHAGAGKERQMVGESRIVGDGTVCADAGGLVTPSTSTGSDTATGSAEGVVAGTTGVSTVNTNGQVPTSNSNLDVASFAIQSAAGSGQVSGLLLAVFCCFVL